MSKHTRHEHLTELRKRAEAQLTGEVDTLRDASPEEVAALVQELRMHQLELGLQNEELRRAQLELETSQARYVELYDLAPVGYLTLSAKEVIQQANLTAAKLFGVGRKQLVKQPLTRFILPEDQDIYYRLRRQLSEPGASQAYEMRMQRVNAAPFWARLEVTVAQDADGAPVCRAVLSDITDRKRAEQTLQQAQDGLEQRVREQTQELRRANEELHRASAAWEQTFNAVPDLIMVLDRECRIVRANRAMTAKLGPPGSRFFGLRCHELVHGRDATPEYCPHAALMRDGCEHTVEITDARLGGTFILSASPLHDAAGRLTGSVHVARDITERKRTAEELQRSEEKYRDLVESANSIIMRRGVDGCITFLNEFGQKFFGYDAHEVLGRNVVGTIIPETDSSGRDLRAMMRDISTHPEAYATNENENMRKNGERVWVAWANKAVRDQDGNVVEVLCIGNDVTERRQMNVRIERTRQAETLAHIAAGVAHEVRNPLNAIMALLEVMDEDLGKNPAYAPFLQHLQRQVDRLAKLMRDLLDLGTTAPTPTLQPIPIGALARSTIVMWQQTNRGSYCSIVLHATPNVEALQVTCDPDRLQQVLHNLYDNARQHSPHGSVISVEVLEPAEGFARIRVVDQGGGFSHEALEHAGEPFFTTRSGGTGLGLCLVKRIVEAHHGELAMWNNTPPPGCTVEVRLPVTGEDG